MSVNDFATLVNYPIMLFNRLIQWWGSITIGGFTVWQWLLSFLLFGIGVAVLRILMGSIPSIGIASAAGRAKREQEYADRRADRRFSKSR